MDGIERLGPWPEKAVAAFRDLGLTEREIARYFRVHPSVVRLVGRNLKERTQVGSRVEKSDHTQSRDTRSI